MPLETGQDYYNYYSGMMPWGNQGTGTTNQGTGITQLATPGIKYPSGYYPQAGGGGGGTGLGIFGNLNPDTLKTINQGVWSTDMAAPGAAMTASYKPVESQIAQTQGGIWKNVNTGQNVYHANMDVTGPLISLYEKMTGADLTGKYGLPDDFTQHKLGSTMGYEWEDTDPLANIKTFFGKSKRDDQKIINEKIMHQKIQEAQIAEQIKQEQRERDARKNLGTSRPTTPGGWHPGVGDSGPQGTDTPSGHAGDWGPGAARGGIMGAF